MIFITDLNIKGKQTGKQTESISAAKEGLLVLNKQQKCYG